MSWEVVSAHREDFSRSESCPETSAPWRESWVLALCPPNGGHRQKTPDSGWVGLPSDLPQARGSWLFQGEGLALWARDVGQGGCPPGMPCAVGPSPSTKQTRLRGRDHMESQPRLPQVPDPLPLFKDKESLEKHGG